MQSRKVMELGRSPDSGLARMLLVRPNLSVSVLSRCLPAKYFFGVRVGVINCDGGKTERVCVSR